MGTKWNNGTRDIGGILRKTNQHPATIAAASVADDEKRLGELLVFGYACKIFRDDDKARLIDQGKHLIPWMGDETLKIDRYDVRAALPDISKYEPPPGGYTNRLEYLTPAEQRAEQLCEEERYFSLYNNDEEEQMYQEEELKRLHREGASSYGQVQFDYNNTSNTQENKKVVDEKADEPDEVYTPPTNLAVPPNVATPDTMKQHAIIERTAKFISAQGPQMEILIKTKQSNNPQFEFLTQNSKLFPYYKFILNSFKDGTYPEQTTSQTAETTSTKQPPEPAAQTESTNSQIPAHPVFVHPASISIPTIKYKPSADCAYTQLISKIKGVPIPEEPPDDQNKSDAVIESAPSLYYSSYYAANHMDSEQYYSVEPSITPAQPVQKEPAAVVEPESSQVEVKKISSGLMLAQCYGSDTEDETDTDESKPAYVIPENYPVPSSDMQHIIEKTAIYVAKNGKTFEEILCTKQDERFQFLDPSNEFYPYYLKKVTSLNSKYVPTSNGHGKPKQTTPVSFSIKSKDDSAVPIPALLQETSDDDDPESKTKTTNHQNHADKPPTPSPNAIIAAATAARISAAIAQANAAKNGSAANVARSRFDIDNTGSIVNRGNAGGGAATAATTNTTKSEVTQQRELKRAEEKVKDRLAQIAREKLGLISKEKQLQLERKKRAMAFLNQIKTTPNSSSGKSPSNSTTPPLKNSAKGDTNSNSDDDDGSNSDTSSVHSIPISSYQNDDDDDAVDDEKDDRRSRSTERLTPPPVEKSSPKKDDNYTQVIDDDDDDDDDVRIIETENDNNDINSNHHRHHHKTHRSSRKRDRSKRHRSRSRSAKDDDDDDGNTSRHRHKKKKSKHSKKKSKKRSRSPSPEDRKSSTSREKKRAKKSDSSSTKSKKSSKKKKRRERDS